MFSARGGSPRGPSALLSVSPIDPMNSSKSARPQQDHHFPERAVPDQDARDRDFTFLDVGFAIGGMMPTFVTLASQMAE